MNHFHNQDDDIVFNPTSASNLSSLFGTSMNLQKGAEINLTYTAPKQPKANPSIESSNSSKEETQSSVVCSKVVDVYKLLKNIPIFEGKCGIAVIGCRSVNVYEIILYKSKQETFARSRLRPDFIFIIETNNFAYFCDDEKYRWCIHFKSPEELKEFSKSIQNHNGKIIFNNEANPNQGNTISDPKIKLENEIVNTPIVSFPEQLESDSTSATSSNVAKANILSRMAKMGQSILPTTPNCYMQSDAEVDELKNKDQLKMEGKLVKHDTTSDKFKYNVKSKIVTSSIPESISHNDDLIPLSVHTENPINYNKFIQQSFPNQVMWNQPQIMALPDPLNLFISESRIHNCEVRMNINQLSAKLDQILFKLGNSSNNNIDVASLVVEQKQEAGQLLEYLKEEIKKHTEKTVQNSEVDDLQCDIELNLKIISEQTVKINQLQEENNFLKSKLNLTEETKKHILELQSTIDKQQISLQELQTFHDQPKKQNTDEKILELNGYIEKLKSELSCINMKTDQFENKIKQTMSILYQQIVESLNDENKSEASINTNLAKLIKNFTFTIIKNFQLDFQNSESNAS